MIGHYNIESRIKAMEENIIVKLLNDKDLGTSRLLTREEEQEIFSLYAKDKSLREDVQTIMINANQKLVYSIARKYRPFMNASYDDIVQLGRIGLSKAVDKYDLSKNTKFATYATYWIKQSIDKGLQSINADINEPIKVANLRNHFYSTEEEMEASLKRKVTFNEVANKMGMNPTELKLLFDSSNVASLDETVDDDREISAIEKIKDSNSTPQEFVLEDEKRHLINDAMERLSPREQEIIKYRYNSEDGVLHSFAEVAEKLGISRQRVQKIEQKAIKEMKEYIKNCEK